MSRDRFLSDRWVWSRLQRLWGDAVCLVRHPNTWKFDGNGPNGSRWYCRRCGRTWSFSWR